MHRSKEVDVLLYYLKGGKDRFKSAGLDGLSHPEWDSFINLSERLGVAPLLYHRLRSRDMVPTIPPYVIERLKEAYFGNSMRNMKLFNELAKVLDLFRSEGIPVIVLKGAHLAEVVYDNSAVRSMGDVDILVRKEDLEKAEEKMLEICYNQHPRPSIETQCKRRYHLIPFRTSGDLLVEVHWTITQLTSSFKVEPHEIWERARPVTIADSQAMGMSPEDLLLHLSIHHTRSYIFAGGLKAYCDVAETIGRYKDEIDWNLLQSIASRWQTMNSLLLVLHLTHELLDAPVPDEMLRKVRHDPLLRYLSRQVKGRCFNISGEVPWHLKVILQLKMRERFGEKMRFMCNLLGATFGRQRYQ